MKKQYTCVMYSVLGMVGSACTILADTFFVSHRLGEVGLAALNIAIVVFGVINGVGLLVGVGCATRYCQQTTTGNTRGARGAFGAGVWLGAGFGLALCGVGATLATPLAAALGASGAVLAPCGGYLRVVLLFAPAFLLNHVVMAFLRHDNRPRLAMAGLLAGSCANVVLDYVFMFPLGLGTTGAALATGLAPCVGLVVCSVGIAAGGAGFCPVVPRMPAPNRVGWLLSPGVGLFATELFGGVVFAPWLAGAFGGQGGSMLPMATNGVRLYFLGFVFAGYNLLAVSLFGCTNRHGSALVTSLLRGVVGPVVLAVALGAWLGMPGLWLATPVAEVFCTVFVLTAPAQRVTIGLSLHDRRG